MYAHWFHNQRISWAILVWSLDDHSSKSFDNYYDMLNLFVFRYGNGAVQQQQYGVRTSKELLLTRPLQEVYPPLLHVRWPHPHHRRPLSGKTLEVVKKWRHKFWGFSRGRDHEMNIIVNVYNSFIQNYSYEGLSKT